MPYRVKNKWGFVDSNMKIKVTAVYDTVYFMGDGYALIEKDKMRGLVDSTGRVITECIYTSIGPFENGLAKVYGGKNGLYGFMNKKGKAVTKIGFQKVRKFSEGYAAVRSNYKWGYINSKGKLVIPIKYESAGPFRDGYAPVLLNEDAGFIDKKGKEMIPAVYDLVRYRCEGNKSTPFPRIRTLGAVVHDRVRGIHMDHVHRAAIYDPNKAIINAKGENVSLLYREAEWFSDNLIQVKEADNWGLMDCSGNIVVPCRFSGIAKYKNPDSLGIELVQVSTHNRKTGILDINGNVVFAPKYDQIGNFYSTGFARVVLNGKIQWIDIEGNIYIQKDNYVVQFLMENGMAIVSKGDRTEWGVVDKNGEIIIPLEYDRITYIPDKWFKIQKNKKKGIFTLEGEKILPVNCTHSDYNPGWGKHRLQLVIKDKKWGVYSRNWEQITP